ncbi:hypothetical protein C8J27_11096 [Rhodobacter aestuarii]|uniref:Uncharacterized protein n=1 Tax=Rhodobacter aestuarii TaxID=453582 RepID=A0A1N7Q273_9RHOB|nr:hypothetical protein [Rhodobacter aestuarii]PTV94045.1 hypothetical protein C8J27_11096 [Rhodobacter aestuarii]SIT16942.1 hypothetical protein SAMN05421580_11296 [Rhodobacter aestuarii]
MSDRLTPEEIVTRAGTGLGKIDLWGARGITMVSFQEIEAMACLLADCGLTPIYPGAPVPQLTFTTTRNKEPQNV